MAAVLAAGAGAVLSHRSAAVLWGLRVSERNRVDVTTESVHVRPGVRAHRAQLAPDEVGVERGIPVTTAARTLLDLAAVLRRPQLERAVERAEGLRLADSTPLDALLRRHRGRRGTAALREALAEGVTPTLTRSELEDAFLTFLDAHGLPRPEVNVRAGEKELDFRWPSRRLIVEMDGRETHLTSAAFERDRARDRELQAKGWRVVRVTWRQLQGDGPAVARDLAELLYRSAPWPPQPGA